MNKDRIGSFVLFIFGLSMAIGSVSLSIGTIQESGAGLFPLIIASCLCLVSLIRWIRPEHSEVVVWKDIIARVNVKPWKIIFLSGLFVLGMEPAGYMATAIFYLFGLFSWVCKYGLTRALLLALIIAPVSWIFFAKVLSLQLPMGPWGF
jgi:hypothetical protein